MFRPSYKTFHNIIYRFFLLGFCLGPVFFVPNALAFDTKASPDFQKFLNALEWKAKNYGWDDLGLRNIPWEYYRKSVHNYPLMFVKFGNSSKNCVLFFGGIHGDELPSVYLMLQLAHYIQDNPDFFQDQCVVIAPLVNPDGFLSPTPTRTNASHVDLNRNFPTRDWKTSALKQWKARGANHRYFPGNQPASEREVLFQMALIKRFHPQKILSVHSPLNCFDYDGPSSDLDSFEKWMEQVSEESNHPLKKFGYYPGSLGNYAGHERNIFTITLELPSSDPQQSKTYFKKFQPSILKFINLPVTGVPPHIKMVNQ